MSNHLGFEYRAVVDTRSQDFGWGRRKSLRRHFGYPGQIYPGGDLPASACMIVDMSETGAQLQVAAEAQLPYEFWLLIGGNAHVRRQCRVVWRSGSRLGVQFRTNVQAARRPAQPA